ncbi:type 1 glutamine amidotransferase domain-containing protein [Saccharothrix sp. NRRL B-16314]|uniref:type 1 glutamine amidotransferase domain-containing protein n=1 Tax=Saccharothrix sp. NRRL B-16314 TaxID=1463825 RepID=UPI00052756BE|nr:type 1 glutamine amidotransferase domain-containing protein [Saccharothrix sp. NRRL B-16314]
MSPRALFVLTGHGVLGDTRTPTGYHLGETVEPWRALRAAGVAVDFASPRGGPPPMIGAEPEHADFLADADGGAKVRTAIPVAEAEPTRYAAVYYVGGHGAMWDFPDDPAIQHLTRSVHERGGVVAAICHGQAALVNTTLADGTHFVYGKRLTAFSHEAEHTRGLTNVVPFPLQHTLEARGAVYSRAADKAPHTVVDGRLITGQNPASAPTLARLLAAAITG